MPAKGKKPVVKKKANGYKMPAPIRLGEVINDSVTKKTWTIGPSIGVGGFGEIYSACEGSPKKASGYPFVIKIEPHENGPLFVEKHFYIRNANKDDITKYMKEKKLSSFGMPTYFGNGSHEYNGEKYRYLVLERYGKDVWSLFKECNRSFPAPTVFLLGLQMLDVLEYIHGRGYVHADVKGANILLGLRGAVGGAGGAGGAAQAYLVDFGLAARLSDKPFKPDPKCAHNGTIEYTSRDAHLGVSTMRGDLEILGYNMLQWLVGDLPWEKSLKEPKTVQGMKETFMKNVRSTVSKQYPHVPDALIKFFEHINTLQPKDTPDYSKCRQLFESYLKSQGKSRTSKLDFTPNKTKSGAGKQTVDDIDADSQRKNGDTLKRRGRKAKAQAVEIEDSDHADSSDEKQTKKTTKKAREIESEEQPARSVDEKSRKVKRTAKVETSYTELSDDSTVKKSTKKHTIRTRKIENNDSDLSDNSTERKQNKNKRTRSIENSENELSDDSAKVITTKKKMKRKSLEPSVVVNVKKVKLTPKATPPAKRNHANIATQTSAHRRRSPRQVSFDSPISEVIGKSPDQTRSTVNSSGDIFDDSFVIEEKKVKRKRKLLSHESVTVTKVLRKKVTGVKKERSWKDVPSVLNGRAPPK